MKSDKIILEAVEALANYHADGSACIEKAAELLDVEYDAVKDAIDMNEVDNIGFLYDVETETWANDAEMIEWGKQNLPLQ